MLPVAHMGITVIIVRAMETKHLVHRVDYRLLLAAALLPDIIDKPLRHILFGHDLFASGRALGHSAAFLLALVLVGGIYRLWRQDSLPATILLGASVHDILDMMWVMPDIFCWPFYGWAFPEITPATWQGSIAGGGLINIRYLDAWDTLGALLILYYFMRLAFADRIISFMKSGRLYFH